MKPLEKLFGIRLLGWRLVNRSHHDSYKLHPRAYSSLNGNFRIEEKKKATGVKKICTTDEGSTISSGNLFYHGALQNKSWPRASVQSCCNSLLSITGTTVVVLTCVGFFWIPTQDTIWGAKYARGRALELAWWAILSRRQPSGLSHLF